MFRDPGFHRALRARVFPLLRTHPFVRLWVAGCSTGRGGRVAGASRCDEADLLERTRIYATDMDAGVLRARARAPSAREPARLHPQLPAAAGRGVLSGTTPVAGGLAVFDPGSARRRLRAAQPRDRTARSTSSSSSCAAT
jgi:hypothetical protein